MDASSRPRSPVARVRRGRALAYAAGFLGLLAASYPLGSGYGGRLAHHAGYHLVAVDDAVAHAPAPPRHTVFVLVDGLRRDAAARSRTVARLREVGQCRATQVGPISISRAMYAVFSTGLEQDRSGSRNNSETSPLAADSIWQVARRSGRRVVGYSEEGYFRELFPDGFDRYETPPAAEDYFAQAELTDLLLVHPVYVDGAGHAHGAASPEYAAAAERADREVTAFLQRLDLSRDLLVFTSDHGHSAAGGHGGSQPAIEQVILCFAGRGVRPSSAPAALDVHALAPTLAVLMGLPFPRHMRASEDGLDGMWGVIDPAAFPAPYLADRRAALARFRAANRAQLAGWLGDAGPATWPTFYGVHRRAQRARLGALAVGLLLLFGVGARRGGLRRALGFTAWALTSAGLAAGLFVAQRGSFDFTAINTRAVFLVAILSSGTVASLLATVGHLVVHRDLSRLLQDQWLTTALALGVGLGHAFVYGWVMGFPLPGHTALFLPYFASGVAVSFGLVGLGWSAAAALRPR